MKPKPEKPQKDPGGSYLLVVHARAPFLLSVGRLGELDFNVGVYVYCGSAKGGLRARIGRHLRKSGKKLHWHIDYLLNHPKASIIQVWTIPGGRVSECELVSILSSLPGARIQPEKFGSSDCRSGCRGHLVHFSKRPDVALLPIEGLAEFKPVPRSALTNP